MAGDRRRIIVGGLILIFLAGLLSYNAGWATATSMSTDRHPLTIESQDNYVVALAAQAKRTPTPRATITPTPTRLSSRLRSQVFFGLGGGGLTCSSAISPDMRLPAVAFEKFSEGGGPDIACIYGFQPGNMVTVKIFDPGNRQVYAVNKYIQDDDMFGYGFPVNFLFLSPIPNNAPAGDWRVVAEGPGALTESRFYVPDRNLTVNKGVKSGAAWLDPRRLAIFMPGDTLLLQGVGFSGNQEYAIGLYRNSEGDNLMSGQTVRTNRNGNFEAGFSITKQFTPGYYYAVVVANPDQEIYKLEDELISFQVLKPSQVCPGAMPTVLKKGDHVLVSAGQPNNVREKFGLNSRQVGKVAEYEELEILTGPKCADGMVWWKIYSTNTGLDGWTAEGKNGDYWLTSLGLY